MKFGPLPLDIALGHVLGHNIADASGNRLLRKGRPLTQIDLDKLGALGRSSVYVAQLEPGDITEDDAARAIAAVVAGSGLHTVGAASGRLNLLASHLGVVRVNARKLNAINAVDGITIATVMQHSAVERRAITATIKIIPFAIPASGIDRVREISADGPVVTVDALPPRNVMLILSGSATARERITRDFRGPLEQRVARLGGQITRMAFIPLEDESGEAALAAELAAVRDTDCRLVILAGETAIMDSGDIAPRAVVRAGGVVTVFGAPVDPGNLLMVAYLEDIPVLGAPGCARSPKVNIIDWVLPQLIAGDRIERADIIGLGMGGLLEEIHERPAPRAA